MRDREELMTGFRAMRDAGPPIAVCDSGRGSLAGPMPYGDANGGPVEMPEHADFMLKNTRHRHGFYGASSMGPPPAEVAQRDRTAAFKKIGPKGGRS